MIKTEYICDNCGAVQQTPEQMWEIGIVYNPPFQAHIATIKHKQLWCRECMVKAHLLGDEAELVKTKAPPIAPSLEDLIRVLIQEEMDARDP